MFCFYISILLFYWKNLSEKHDLDRRTF